jgi:hypothetical protein
MALCLRTRTFRSISTSSSQLIIRYSYPLVQLIKHHAMKMKEEIEIQRFIS